MEKVEGYSYQECEPTPDKPCEIKTIVCNDIEIPIEYLKQTNVVIDGKKYIELQRERNLYKDIIAELYEALEEIDDEIMETCQMYDVNGITLKKILNKVKVVNNDENSLLQ